MNILVIGAGGRTGHLAVERAIAAGHEITALLHEQKDAKHEPHFPSGVEVIHGDVRNPTRLDQVMLGRHAVIDALGGHKPWAETHIEENAAKVIVEVMKRNQVKRLIAISVLGAGDSKDQASWPYEHLLMPTFLRGAMPDKEAMEAEVKASGLDFVLVRPPMLTDADPTGDIRIVPPGETAHKLTRADLAQFLVDQLTSDQYLGQAVTVANS